MFCNAISLKSELLALPFFPSMYIVILRPFSRSYSSLSILPFLTLAEMPIPVPMSTSASVAPIFFDFDNTELIIFSRFFDCQAMKNPF